MRLSCMSYKNDHTQRGLPGMIIDEKKVDCKIGSGEFNGPRKEKVIPSRRLEAFPNHHPERDYVVTMHTEEFTCVCPLTGQPDFAKLKIQYIPDKRVLESKSLKLYLHSFRAEGTFHEHVINVILDDIVGALAPAGARLPRFRSARRNWHLRGCGI